MDTKKIKNIRWGTIFPTLRVAVILLLAGVVFAIVFLQEKRSKEEPAKRAGQELTEEEKIKILESLSAPLDAPRYTEKEKREILKSLSPPSGQTTLSDEEKKKILESLSAPTQ